MEEKKELMTEQEIQQLWAERGIGVAKDFDKRDKFYHLVMFPYPSGDLHVGHWKNFAVADIIARKKLLDGYNLLSPIGFDAFGLPAENAAIKDGVHPAIRTKQNIEAMTEQLKLMGPVYDWSRVVDTSTPEYYKWTQWLFLLLYKQGLAYRSKMKVNWCPSCQTVLANEQVKAGLCELCETEVELVEREQWAFRITDYADRLFDDLEKVDWPEPTKIAQRNWIGRSKGQLIKFPIKDSNEVLEVFTTRPDTIKGVTYMVVAPEHPIMVNGKWEKANGKAIAQYIEKARKKTELERQKQDKSGVDTGLVAINPVTNEELPVWVADYVLAGYGTGAIMAVPAHDERDREFAEANGLPIGLGELDDQIDVGEPKVQYRLRDWTVSRQRYWGAPIPMIQCEKCGYQPVPEKDLPVVLPDIKEYLPKGKPPLATAPEDWLEVVCPKCGGRAEREVDTIDTFVDSSWYFLRYADPNNSEAFADKEKMKYWLPVDLYIGGAEHTVLHLLYARFFTKVLFDAGYIEFDEPFAKLRHQGMLLGPDHRKMSKSRGNVVDPDDLVADFGADPIRLYLAFMGPFDQGGPWSTDGFNGVVRFLKRIEKLPITKHQLSITNLQKLIKKITEDTEELKFNTAVAAMMSFLNEIEKKGLSEEDYRKFLIILSPYAPHTAERLWQKASLLRPAFLHLGGEDPDSHPRGVPKRGVPGWETSIFEQSWPEVGAVSDEATVTLPVQVNGKYRGSIEIAPNADQREAERMAKKVALVNKAIAGKSITQVHYKAGKILNFVVS